MSSRITRDPRTKDSTIHLTNVTTKIGDRGTTALGDRTKAPKHNPRVQAYGSVDEANCFIGQAVATLARFGTQPDVAGPNVQKDTAEAMHRLLRQIQNDLFDVGADLATPVVDSDSKSTKRPGSNLRRIDEDYVSRLEAANQQFLELTEPIHSFVLPGGSQLAAELHIARGVTRRAERDAWAAISLYPDINQATARYLNRLSDLLFILSRVANLGTDETIWIPQNRDRAEL